MIKTRRHALLRLAARMPARDDGHPVTVPTVGDPFTTPWMRDRTVGISPRHWLDTAHGHVAVDHARDLLSIGDVTPLDGADQPHPRAVAGREQLLEELDVLLDTYMQAVRLRPAANRLGRARAALAIAMWETVVRTAPGTGQHRKTGQWFRRPAPRDPDIGRTLSSLQVAPAIAGPIAQGVADDQTIKGLLHEIANTRSVADQWQLLLLALSTIRPPRRISGPAVLRVLSAAIANAQEREDRNVVTLTRLLFDEYPRPTPAIAASAQLYALCSCAVVLSARHEWRSGLTALHTADGLLDDAHWPAGRDPRVERSEWRYQLVLHRSAVERRRAEHQLVGSNPAAAMHTIERATALLDEARNLLLSLPGFRVSSLTSDSGDANAHYLTRLCHRTAEVESLRIQAGRLLPLSGTALANAVRAAHTAATAAADVARADPRHSTPAVPLIKARLSWALAVGDEDAVAGLTRRFLQQGWPVYRSLNPIVLALTGRSDALPRPCKTPPNSPPQSRGTPHREGNSCPTVFDAASLNADEPEQLLH